MIDMQSAVQAAVFGAVNGATDVTDLANVWQNPPEDPDLVTKGLVIIGLVSLDGSETKDGGFEKATLPVLTYVRKPDATALYGLNCAVRNALEGQRITAAGADIGAPVFLGADPKLMEDGETYFDELQFEMFVQAE